MNFWSPRVTCHVSKSPCKFRALLEMMAKWTVCGVSVFTLCAVFSLFAEPGHGNQCTRCWPASLFNRVMDCKDIYTGCILLMTPKNWAGIVREVKVSRCEVRIEGGGSLAMVRDRMGNLCKAFKGKCVYNFELCTEMLVFFRKYICIYIYI